MPRVKNAVKSFQRGQDSLTEILAEGQFNNKMFETDNTDFTGQ